MPQRASEARSPSGKTMTGPPPPPPPPPPPLRLFAVILSSQLPLSVASRVRGAPARPLSRRRRRSRRRRLRCFAPHSITHSSVPTMGPCSPLFGIPRVATRAKTRNRSSSKLSSSKDKERGAGRILVRLTIPLEFVFRKDIPLSKISVVRSALTRLPCRKDRESGRHRQ